MNVNKAYDPLYNDHSNYFKGKKNPYPLCTGLWSDDLSMFVPMPPSGQYGCCLENCSKRTGDVNGCIEKCGERSSLFVDCIKESNCFDESFHDGIINLEANEKELRKCVRRNKSGIRKCCLKECNRGSTLSNAGCKIACDDMIKRELKKT
jgi:hypothetical protein